MKIFLSEKQSDLQRSLRFAGPSGAWFFALLVVYLVLGSYDFRTKTGSMRDPME